jgi:hypothetical protein
VKSTLAVVVALTVLPGLGPMQVLAQSGTAADMTKFTAACAGSQVILAVVGDAAGAEDRRTTMCTCLVESLTPRISTADADILATDLDGTATEATHTAYAGYAAAEKVAGEAFNACFAQLEGTPPQEEGMAPTTP